VPKLRWLPSAQANLVDIVEYITRQSGNAAVARRFYKILRDKCAKLASLRATVGVARPELRQDIRSFPFRGYIIFFRYREGVFEVINVIEGHRDFDAFFAREKSQEADPDPT
jgi:toxin ParE1/3/4